MRPIPDLPTGRPAGPMPPPDRRLGGAWPARVIDEEVARILSEQGTRARSELQASMHVLHALADELLVRETLGADDIGRILHGPDPVSVAG